MARIWQGIRYEVIQTDYTGPVIRFAQSMSIEQLISIVHGITAHHTSSSVQEPVDRIKTGQQLSLSFDVISNGASRTPRDHGHQ